MLGGGRVGALKSSEEGENPSRERKREGRARRTAPRVQRSRRLRQRLRRLRRRRRRQGTRAVVCGWFCPQSDCSAARRGVGGSATLLFGVPPQRHENSRRPPGSRGTAMHGRRGRRYKLSAKKTVATILNIICARTFYVLSGFSSILYIYIKKKFFSF